MLPGYGMGSGFAKDESVMLITYFKWQINERNCGYLRRFLVHFLR